MKTADLEQKAATAIETIIQAAGELAETEKELRRREIRREGRREQKNRGDGATEESEKNAAAPVP